MKIQQFPITDQYSKSNPTIFFDITLQIYLLSKVHSDLTDIDEASLAE